MVELTERKPIWRTIWFAVVVCCGLLAICLLPGVNRLITAIDYHAAVALNRMAGISPVFDRIVLLIADEDGRERVVLLVLIWFVTACWFVPGRLAKARMVGTLLFVSTVMVAFFIVDAMLDDIFTRKSPSYFLDPFNSIGDILNHRVDLKDKRTFPSAEGMILFSTGFLLLRLGRKRGAMLALLLGLTVPLMPCVAGLSWLSDVYLGALPVSFFVSAIAVETPFRRLFGFYIDMAAAAFDQAEKFLRNLGPMWRHRNLYWSSQKVFHMEASTKRFIMKDLPGIIDPEKLHRDGKPFVEVPLGGLRSVIRLVSMGPLKVVVRGYPVNRRSDAVQHFEASELLLKNGIRVPKVYFMSDGPKRHGALFMVEEFIDGASKKPDELSDGDILAAAEEMARLHKIKSNVWGPVATPRTEEYGTVLLRRIDRQIGKVARGPVLRGQQAKVSEVREWFSGWRHDLNQIRDFSLIHGMLHRENCIFESSGEFCLLDITTMEWGVASSDLVNIHYSQCGGNPELIAKFDAAYLALFEPEQVQQILRWQPLFEAAYHLSQVAKYTKRLGRGQRQVGNSINKGVTWWHRLLEIVEQ